MRFSVQPRDRIFVKGYGFLIFAKNMSKHRGKNMSKNFSTLEKVLKKFSVLQKFSALEKILSPSENSQKNHKSLDNSQLLRKLSTL